MRKTIAPSDVIEIHVLLDTISDSVTAARRGLRLLRRTYATTSAGLLTLERALSSVRAATEESLALLSYTQASVGDPSPDPARKLVPIYTTSSGILVDEAEAAWCPLAGSPDRCVWPACGVDGGGCPLADRHPH